MLLSVLERAILISLLPMEANFATLKLVRIAKEALSFTDEENKICNFVANTDTGQTTWNEGVEPKEIGLGEVATQLIVEALVNLDKAKKLTTDHMSLYEKFVK
jgi:hypothetical protein